MSTEGEREGEEGGKEERIGEGAGERKRESGSERERRGRRGCLGADDARVLDVNREEPVGGGGGELLMYGAEGGVEEE
eukprot:3939474-Rhodomonas_salina.1